MINITLTLNLVNNFYPHYSNHAMGCESQYSEVYYGFLVFSLLLIQIFLSYFNIRLFYQVLNIERDHPLNNWIKKIILSEKRTKEYFVANFYIYLFFLYFFEFLILIYCRTYNLSNKEIASIFLILIIMNSLIGDLQADLINFLTDWNSAKDIRQKLINDAFAILEKEEFELRKYHVVNFGKVFENLIDEEMNFKKEAKLNEIDKAIADDDIADLDLPPVHLTAWEAFFEPDMFLEWCVYIFVLIYITLPW